ncbi:DUF2922 domain-containing protein [Clostridium frigidicarnis]|uniref:DUF2922 domain-containing protein n=1 Tax=Clostridium frigidicarnis TaxID=84698 RepID=A0A1I1APP3_9CLOT|nr:DUF2922 domain-containing protein [Clostridium frigidicarnis]SFB38438.1 Protein of unknown function [Clostridium frigidicarnis]
MNSRTLVMTFLNDIGKKVNVRIPYVKEDLSKDEVAAVMDALINSKAIISDGSYLTTKSSATVTTQSVDKIYL